MSGLNQIQQLTNSWASEGKLGGNSQNLFLRDGDIALFWFISKGDDDDPYFEVYMSHEYPPALGAQYKTLRPCPVLSAWDQNYDCPGCKADVRAKPQMAMWLWVGQILSKDKRPEAPLELVSFQGRQMWGRAVNDVRIWETSAWRESPLDDIMWTYHALGESLWATTMALQCTGQGMAKRYKVVSLPNTEPLSPEAAAELRAKCTPVRSLLMKRLAGAETVSAAAVAPAAAGSEPLSSFRPIIALPAADAGNATAPAPPRAVNPIIAPPGVSQNLY